MKSNARKRVTFFQNTYTDTGIDIDRMIFAKYTIPPRKLLRQIRRERRRAVRSKGESWHEDLTNPSDALFLDASTFVARPIFDLPRAKQEQIVNPDKYLVSPNGAFAYQNRVLDAGTQLRIHGHGNVVFDGDVTIPVLIDLKRDSHGHDFENEIPEANRVYFGNVWMSLTPNEMISQRDGIKAANGTVVIGGLGLGWFLRKVCERESVDRVIVVEASKELLDWYGYEMCLQFPKVTDVVCGDIYDQFDQHDSEAVYLLDIWPTQSCSGLDRQFIAAKRRLGERLWGWGDGSNLQKAI